MTSAELKASREFLHLTQRELANILGVYQQSINRWEQGERKIPPYLHLALEALDRRIPCRAKENEIE